MAEDPGLDLGAARELFEESTDFTIGLEEEFAILDPATLELDHRFEELYAQCRGDEVLAEAAAGELIDTEIEIRSGRSLDFAEAVERQSDRRERLFRLADGANAALAAMGSHPWASYLDQHIIETTHYERLRQELRWVAQRNNTWSLHVHVGIQGADRAIAVCDHLRAHLPALLAASANSPFLDGRDTGLHSIRTQLFTRSFPRCGVHQPFGDWRTYTDFIDVLKATSTIVEATQLWWSVRPHHSFGTVELRICDAQSDGSEAFSMAALIAGCIAQTALDHDDGKLGEPLADRKIEENLWRAIRRGREGSMIDWDAGEEIATELAIERLIEWTAPAREGMRADVDLPARNGAQRARDRIAQGGTISDSYRESVEETRATYAPLSA
jgi:carboxylate-amine ligase